MVRVEVQILHIQYGCALKCTGAWTARPQSVAGCIFLKHMVSPNMCGKLVLPVHLWKIALWVEETQDLGDVPERKLAISQLLARSCWCLIEVLRRRVRLIRCYLQHMHASRNLRSALRLRRLAQNLPGTSGAYLDCSHSRCGAVHLDCAGSRKICRARVGAYLDCTLVRGAVHIFKPIGYLHQIWPLCVSCNSECVVQPISWTVAHIQA